MILCLVGKSHLHVILCTTKTFSCLSVCLLYNNLGIDRNMCCGTHVRNLSQVQVNWFSLCSLILVIHYFPRSLRIMERSFQFSWTPAIIINEYCMCPCKFNLIGNLSSIIWLFALATSVYTDVFWEVQGFTSCFLILLSRTTSCTLLLFSFISLLFRIPAFHTFLIPHSASVNLFIWLWDNNNYYFLLARIQRIKKSTSADHYRWKKKQEPKYYYTVN